MFFTVRPEPYFHVLPSQLRSESAERVAESIRALIRAAATGRTLNEIPGATIEDCRSLAATAEDKTRLEGPGGFWHLREAIRLFREHFVSPDQLPEERHQFIPALDAAVQAATQRLAYLYVDGLWPPRSVSDLIDLIIDMSPLPIPESARPPARRSPRVVASAGEALVLVGVGKMADFLGIRPQTIRIALREGKIRGAKQDQHGRWTAHSEALTSWDRLRRAESDG